MAELDQWVADTEYELKEATGLDNIAVTGGPYRGYDIGVDFQDGIYMVDFYSPVRFDERFAKAFDYAVQCIKEHAAGDTAVSQTSQA